MENIIYKMDSQDTDNTNACERTNKILCIYTHTHTYIWKKHIPDGFMVAFVQISRRTYLIFLYATNNKTREYLFK